MTQNHLAISPDPETSRLATGLLRDGASAAEAAVAIGARLSVVLPHFCGIGGDAIWLLSTPDGDVTALNGIGQAPMDVNPDAPLALRGPGSILTTAGALRTWQAALDMQPTGRSLHELLAPAIEAARIGAPVSASQSFWTEMRKDEMPSWPGMESFRNAHRGELQVQPELADTLERLAALGLDDFYSGALAADIQHDLSGLGSCITAMDLAATAVEPEETLRVPYRDHVLHAPPPPSQGAATLAIMAILDHLGPAPALGSAEDYHLMVEAVKRAFLHRGGIDDSPEARALADRMTAPEFAAHNASQINPDQALNWPHVWQSADTVHFAARDKRGYCVSALQSTYFDWGSGCRLPKTGIIWHNRGASFGRSSGANQLASGRRPFHTLSPGIATRDGKPVLLYGTQGADGQPQTTCVLLRHLIDHTLSPEMALAAPRFLLGRTFSDSRDSLKLEPMSGSAQLAQMGHEIADIPALSPLAGMAGVIQIAENDIVTGATDPRISGH